MCSMGGCRRCSGFCRRCSGFCRRCSGFCRRYSGSDSEQCRLVRVDRDYEQKAFVESLLHKKRSLSRSYIKSVR
ncbi:hypothetical protein TOL_2576 [Thalassolituus oleivorans MIL-1]|uniref:Uncharacterized protein n=1 Tax=Thalassolituus oleivorans MIL-1 TaxID=1298593 RepID=M5E688_9GAMM|nr:hypothetical protein TOL_2576 [Thalassolituus oleivorans MIL-1]